MKSDFLIALTQLAAERHLPREQVLGAIEVALASAFKKDNPASGQNISVTLNPNTGEVSVFALKTVVETVEDSDKEVTVADAQFIKKGSELGDEVAAAEPLPHNASRIAAQTAKQVVLQRLREAERDLLYQEFQQHEGDIVSGVIEQAEPGRTITLDLGRAQAVLPYEEQAPNERYRKGQRTKVYLISVRSTPKGPEILVSRSHKNMLKRLFEIEVPEVYNGVVEVKAIAREAGFRSKVAVSATQAGIDPVGSCIGIRGNRIQSIVNELQGEKIDIVSWDEEPKTFITNALSPSEPVHVELLEADQTAIVVVPDRQLSLAIGKEGQNTRLAARLTGWRLDIKGMTEWEEIKETTQAKVEATAEAKPVVADEAADAVEEAIAIIEEAGAMATEEASEPVAAEADATPVAEAVTEAPAEEIDEESILEALIQEEEEQASIEAVTEPAAAEGLSVEDLGAFTIDDVELSEDDEEDDEEEEEGELPELDDLPVLIPDAGKIRFAEDIVEEFRGGGRGGRRRRGGGGARGGARGGGARGGEAAAGGGR
ncbi:MAG: transcription termination/antitermination protein NusA [SAR202 cluster bacterium]|jgi:N utilization substance protein A|nr:transcription termination/antitermination protein NusA [SAR202 cluster bacterium]|tara:strand:+ start:14025 stop:15653 length:1629 start_codon:yes stop_codon:yes gene_type:complete